VYVHSEPTSPATLAPPPAPTASQGYAEYPSASQPPLQVQPPLHAAPFQAAPPVAQQYAPQQPYAPQQHAPQQYAPQPAAQPAAPQYAPQQYAPQPAAQQYAPQQYAPQPAAPQYAPQQYAPQPVAPPQYAPQQPAPAAPPAPSSADAPAPIPMKIVISGGFGVGKTTFVGTISDIPPLTTEAAMTGMAVGVDDRGQVSTKTTTTVAMDFGRVAVDRSLVLYLFGTPGQDRFGFMWDDLVTGALGAIVLVDTRRLDDCFAAIDYFEDRQIPFVVVLNRFDGQLIHSVDAVRAALQLDPDVPIVTTDARNRQNVKESVLALLDVVLSRAIARNGHSL
jgi:uncharacterized protein